MGLHVVLVEVVTTVRTGQAVLSCEIEILFALKTHLASARGTLLRVIIPFSTCSNYLSMNILDILFATFGHLGTSLTKAKNNFV